MLRLASLLSLVTFAILSGLPRQVEAAAFTVNTTTDAVDADPGDGVCETATPGQCTLRAAIQEANAAPGADTITLPAGVYGLTIAGAGEDLAATGDLDIRAPLTIVGANIDDTTVDGGDLDVVFEIHNNVLAPDIVRIQTMTIQNGNGTVFAGGGVLNLGNAELSNLAIILNEAHGLLGGGGVANVNSFATLKITDSVVAANDADCSGGGLLNYGGASLEISDSVVQANMETCAGGGGIANLDGSLTITDTTINLNISGAIVGGGGIQSRGSSSVLSIDDSAIRGNEASDGAGVWQDGGSVAIRTSVIHENDATGFGGGVWSTVGDSIAGDLTIEDSTIGDNTASIGAGVYLPEGAVQLLHSTLEGNTAALRGGGVATGGALVTMTNTTISGNSTPGDGGGIAYCYCIMTNVTVTANTATSQFGIAGGVLLADQSMVNQDTLEARNTIIAGNIDNSGAMPDLGCDGNGTFVSLGNNLLQNIDGACSVAGDLTGNIIGVAAELSQLLFHGGPTRTHALLSTSPAIDAGGTTGCPLDDQRGASRPEDGDGDALAVCDIGAYERCNGSIAANDPDADGLTNGAESSLGSDPCIVDTDLDGCSDGEEAGPTAMLGGQRNPLNQYDFYDVSGFSKKIDAVDLALVRQHFNQATGHPQYSAIYDRSPGVAPWAPGAPNGVINGVDINLVRASFNHTCFAPP